MSRLISIELSDEAYESLRRQAEAAGITTERLLAASVERQHGQPALMDESRARAAQERFERHFGELDLADPDGCDNSRIDADLAREYAENHEDF